MDDENFNDEQFSDGFGNAATLNAWESYQQSIPKTPADIVERFARIADRIAKWDLEDALAKLAGLQLSPRFHANFIRLTWASRLVLGLARGTIRPKRADLARLLNVDLAKTDLLYQEDPSEDFFLTPIATRNGEVPVFQGSLGHTAFYLDTMLEAFARISQQNDVKVWASINALSALSRHQASRAGLARREEGGGRPTLEINLPFEPELAWLTGAVVWTDLQLAQSGIARASLEPFILSEAERGPTLQGKIGNSPVDFKPLYRVGDNLLLVSPSAISMAIRALLADHVLATQREADMAQALLEVQAKRLSETRFAATDTLATQWGHGVPFLSNVLEISAGRFVQIHQTAGNFSGWRTHGLVDFAPADPDQAARIIADMRAAKEAARHIEGYRFGTTLYLVGGWGKGEHLDFERPADLSDWGFIYLDVADAIAMAGCRHGTVKDLWRITGLAGLVKRAGFTLENMSGALNLFQWWRVTSHCLVPQNGKEMRAPLGLMMPTDLLFDARKEGVQAHDRRAVAYPGDRYVSVVRHSAFASFGELEPIYVSYGALRNHLLLGVVLVTDRPVWIGLVRPANDDEVTVAYQTWVTALQWLGLVLPSLKVDDPGHKREPVLITLELGPQPAMESPIPDETMLDLDLIVSSDARQHGARVTLGDQWHIGCSAAIWMRSLRQSG